MKAKEYAKIWEDFFIANERNDENYKKILFEILIKFVDECRDVTMKRCNKTIVRTPVFMAVLNEFSDKWKAFAKLVNDGVNEDGFRNWLCNKDKEISEAWERYHKRNNIGVKQ